MVEDKIVVEVPGWQFLCADNAEDILLGISNELAEGFHEALTNGEEVVISNIGQRIGLDVQQQKDESMWVTQKVIDIYTAASVLMIIPQRHHETDSGMWEGDTWENRQGAKLPDLLKMVEAMATATLESVVAHYMAECFEYCWDELQEWWGYSIPEVRTDNGEPTAKAVETKFVELVGEWEYGKLV